jgi:extracellular elastinolytic metalloproteinase
MSREVDVRDPNVVALTAEREQELRDRAQGLAGLVEAPSVTIQEFDPITGNPKVVRVDSVPAALQDAGNFVQRALAFVSEVKDVLGLAPGQPPEFDPAPTEAVTSGGARAVHLQQKYKGIPIFQSAESVRFDAAGALTEVVGALVTVAGDLQTGPPLAVEQAVTLAAGHVAQPSPDELGGVDSFGQPLPPPVTIDVANFRPSVTTSFLSTPERATVLDKGPFARDISASLIWFPLGGDPRLAWEVLLTLPAQNGRFRVAVDANDGRILYAHNEQQTLRARGNVFVDTPDQGRSQVGFPRPWTDYLPAVPGDLQNINPVDWVRDDATTAGFSANAHLGDSGPALTGQRQTDGTVLFDPTQADGDDQKVLNIFFFNCFMHDFFYLLGFRSQDGSFERAASGIGGDPVDARAHSGAVWGTANFVTPADGLSPTMNMGLVTTTGRHTAFDASVVFHEYTHGVTNRLVGGPSNTHALDAPQSKGMGEGWGDYIACTITGRPVVAAWVVNIPNGIRAFRYDDSFPAATDNFGSLGSGRYTASAPHNIGEIWCATLMQMNRNLRALSGPLSGAGLSGDKLGLQLVVDALKLAPANPSFLDMRDAILAALAAKQAAGQLGATPPESVRGVVLKAFEKYGMGLQARSNGALLTGIVPDFGAAGLSAPTAGGRTIRAIVPGSQATGIASSAVVEEDATATAVRVSVEIVDTRAGDLTVELSAPSGARAVLRDREGGDQDRLSATWDSASTPDLTELLRQSASVKGRWTLRVTAAGTNPVGRLLEWDLELDLAGGAAGLTGADGNQMVFRFQDVAARDAFRAALTGIRTAVLVEG